MGFNTDNKTSPVAEKQSGERIAAAITYLRQGWNAQAFQLLSAPGAGLEMSREPSARFALGLCHLRAGDLTSAIPCLEQALHLLGAMSAPGRDERETPEGNETWRRLFAGQIDEKIYLTPMDADFCARFPKAAKETVLLALIYVYQKKGMPEQAQRLATGLTGAMFEEYKKKLSAGNP